jgi:hypothetical protein
MDKQDLNIIKNFQNKNLKKDLLVLFMKKKLFDAKIRKNIDLL